MAILGKFKKAFPAKNLEDSTSTAENENQDVQMNLGEDFSREAKGIHACHQEAYQDGFQDIYALETVDISTVRKMGSASSKPQKEPETGVNSGKANPPVRPKAQSYRTSPSVGINSPRKQEVPAQVRLYREVEEIQPNLDLGQGAGEWIEALRLSEPVQSLNLSLPTAKALLDAGFQTIRDLLVLRSDKSAHSYHLGQGHIDEVREELRAFLGDRNLYWSRSIDFCSLLRGLISDLDRPYMMVLLEKHGLEELLTLSPQEEASFKKISPEGKGQARKQALQLVGQIQREQRLKQTLERICKAFLVPWVRRRQGLASKTELIDRLRRVSEEPKRTRKVLECISELFFEGQFPFESYLHKVDASSYAVDRGVVQAYRNVVERAQTYFYSPMAAYEVEELELFLVKEFSYSWEGFFDGFIRRVIRSTAAFDVHKNTEGQLMVSLAIPL